MRRSFSLMLLVVGGFAAPPRAFSSAGEILQGGAALAKPIAEGIGSIVAADIAAKADVINSSRDFDSLKYLTDTQAQLTRENADLQLAMYQVQSNAAVEQYRLAEKGKTDRLIIMTAAQERARIAAEKFAAEGREKQWEYNDRLFALEEQKVANAAKLAAWSLPFLITKGGLAGGVTNSFGGELTFANAVASLNQGTNSFGPTAVGGGTVSQLTASRQPLSLVRRSVASVGAVHARRSGTRLGSLPASRAHGAR